VWLALPLAYLLYFYHLNTVGMIGPDEPRYASVAREMARSGDWVTPRLWGEPWFEKPALFYWMTAAAFRLGLRAEMAPRLPVALMALAFLGFYWWILKREFGRIPAWCATLILGTCVGWIAYSQVGVTDLPLAASFSAAMLLCLPWIAKGNTRLLPVAATMLGIAVLAKGLVPLVLALPLLMQGRRIRDLLCWHVVLPFLLVALPWYALCYLRNGWQFLNVFFGQQTFSRFYSTALQHPQPWWFYLPVLLAGMLPWAPLVFLVRRRWWHDPRRRFLIALVLFGLVFFSMAVNKLPGYLLPLIPTIAALMGLGLDEVPDLRPWLASCALLLVVYPIAARILPVAVVAGLSRAPRPGFDWTWLLPVGVAIVLWTLPLKPKRLLAVAALAACTAAAIVYLKASALTELNHWASARGLWQQIAGRTADVCVESLPRDWRYGLNFYSEAPLPDCAQERRPLVIRQTPGEVPHLVDRSDRALYSQLSATTNR
jgi:4-amino-4-deoxy-L-arabinose transferase-like glycosyltransferase